MDEKNQKYSIYVHEMTPVSFLNPYLRIYRGLNRDSHSIILGDGPKRRMVGTSSASIGTHDFHLHFRLYFRVMARFSFRPPRDLAKIDIYVTNIVASRH